MKKISKRILGLLISVVMVITSCLTVMANTGKETVVVNGVKLVIETSYNNLNQKVIKVTSDIDSAMVVVDGNKLTINSRNISLANARDTGGLATTVECEIPEYLERDIDMQAASYGYSDTIEDYFFGYRCGFTMGTNYGTFWNLRSGNKNGTFNYYDRDDVNIINYSDNFLRNVKDMKSAEAVTITMLGFTAASVIAGVLATTATAGLTAIVAAVLAAGGTVASAGYFATAIFETHNANYNFNRIKQLV